MAWNCTLYLVVYFVLAKFVVNALRIACFLSTKNIDYSMGWIRLDGKGYSAYSVASTIRWGLVKQQDEAALVNVICKILFILPIQYLLFILCTEYRNGIFYLLCSNRCKVGMGWAITDGF